MYDQSLRYMGRIIFINYLITYCIDMAIFVYLKGL